MLGRSVLADALCFHKVLILSNLDCLFVNKIDKIATKWLERDTGTNKLKVVRNGKMLLSIKVEFTIFMNQILIEH